MKQYEWWITLDHTSHSGLCHTRGGTRWSGSSQQVAAFQHLRLRHVKARCSGSNQTMCFRFFLLFSHKLTTQKNRERERETNSHKFISWLHNLWWGEWYLVCLLCTFERCWLSFCYNILTLLFPLGSLLSNWKHVVPKAFLRSRWLRTLEEDRGWNKSCEMLWMFVNAAWFICYVVDLLPFGCWATKCVREDRFDTGGEGRSQIGSDWDQQKSLCSWRCHWGWKRRETVKSFLLTRKVLLSHSPQAVAKKKKYIPYRSAAATQQTWNMNKPRS